MEGGIEAPSNSGFCASEAQQAPLRNWMAVQLLKPLETMAGCGQGLAALLWTVCISAAHVPQGV